jgi:hypothetical protein
MASAGANAYQYFYNARTWVPEAVLAFINGANIR